MDSANNEEAGPCFVPKLPTPPPPAKIRARRVPIQGCSLRRRGYNKEGQLRITTSMLLAYNLMRCACRGVEIARPGEHEAPLMGILNNQDRYREFWEPRSTGDVAASLDDKYTKLDDEKRQQVFHYKSPKGLQHMKCPRNHTATTPDSDSFCTDVSVHTAIGPLGSPTTSDNLPGEWDSDARTPTPSGDDSDEELDKECSVHSGAPSEDFHMNSAEVHGQLTQESHPYFDSHLGLDAVPKSKHVCDQSCTSDQWMNEYIEDYERRQMSESHTDSGIDNEIPHTGPADDRLELTHENSPHNTDLVPFVEGNNQGQSVPVAEHTANVPNEIRNMDPAYIYPQPTYHYGPYYGGPFAPTQQQSPLQASMHQQGPGQARGAGPTALAPGLHYANNSYYNRPPENRHVQPAWILSNKVVYPGYQPQHFPYHGYSHLPPKAPQNVPPNGLFPHPPQNSGPFQNNRPPVMAQQQFVDPRVMAMANMYPQLHPSQGPYNDRPFQPNNLQGQHGVALWNLGNHTVYQAKMGPGSFRIQDQQLKSQHTVYNQNFAQPPVIRPPVDLGRSNQQYTLVNNVPWNVSGQAVSYQAGLGVTHAEAVRAEAARAEAARAEATRAQAARAEAARAEAARAEAARAEAARAEAARAEAARAEVARLTAACVEAASIKAARSKAALGKLKEKAHQILVEHDNFTAALVQGGDSRASNAHKIHSTEGPSTPKNQNQVSAKSMRPREFGGYDSFMNETPSPYVSPTRFPPGSSSSGTWIISRDEGPEDLPEDSSILGHTGDDDLDEDVLVDEPWPQNYIIRVPVANDGTIGFPICADDIVYIGFEESASSLSLCEHQTAAMVRNLTDLELTSQQAATDLYPELSNSSGPRGASSSARYYPTASTSTRNTKPASIPNGACLSHSLLPSLMPRFPLRKPMSHPTADATAPAGARNQPRSSTNTSRKHHRPTSAGKDVEEEMSTHSEEEYPITEFLEIFDNGEVSDGEGGRSVGRISPCTFLLWAENCMNHTREQPCDFGLKPEIPKDKAPLRPTDASHHLSEAETVGVSCAGKYPQIDEDTGTLFSAAYSVPDHPPVMFDPPGVDPARANFRNREVQYAYDRMNPMAGHELREMRAKLADDGYKTAVEALMASSSGNGRFTKSETADATRKDDGLPLDDVADAKEAYFAEKERELDELLARRADEHKANPDLSHRVQELFWDREMAERFAVGLLTAQANKADKDASPAKRAEREAQIRRHIANSLEQLKEELTFMHRMMLEDFPALEELEETAKRFEREIQAICESVGRASFEDLLEDHRQFELEKKRDAFTEDWLTNRSDFLQLSLGDQGDGEEKEEDYRVESDLDEY